MKKQIISCFIFAYALAVCAEESTTGTYSTSPVNSQAAPQLEWVKTEVQNILRNAALSNGEKAAELLDLDINSLRESSLIIASGHFTDARKNQFIITIPAAAKEGMNLGWETNLWLVVEKSGENQFRTVASMRGDVAYQNSCIDVDGDGIEEVLMTNRVQTENSLNTVQKIYSFKTHSVVYQATSVDMWTQSRISSRKHMKKGQLMYNVLQLGFNDLDGDGKLEITETWIDFNYNGGRRIATIEQKKSMFIKTNTLNLSNGVYR